MYSVNFHAELLFNLKRLIPNKSLRSRVPKLNSAHLENSSVNPLVKIINLFTDSLLATDYPEVFLNYGYLLSRTDVSKNGSISEKFENIALLFSGTNSGFKTNQVDDEFNCHCEWYWMQDQRSEPDIHQCEILLSLCNELLKNELDGFSDHITYYLPYEKPAHFSAYPSFVVGQFVFCAPFFAVRFPSHILKKRPTLNSHTINELNRVGGEHTDRLIYLLKLAGIKLDSLSENQNETPSSNFNLVADMPEQNYEIDRPDYENLSAINDQNRDEWPLNAIRLQKSSSISQGLNPEHKIPLVAAAITNQAQNRLTTNLVEPPSLLELSEQLGLSERTCKRRLQDAGTHYQQLLAEIRLRHAIIWLSRNYTNVSQTASKLGYASVANFSKAFKKWCGVSPTQVRSLLSTRVTNDHRNQLHPL